MYHDNEDTLDYVMILQLINYLLRPNLQPVVPTSIADGFHTSDPLKLSKLKTAGIQ